MYKLLLILFILSLLVNVLVAWKAYDYRKKMILAWAQSHEWVSEYNKAIPSTATAEENPSLVFIGASITAEWNLSHYFSTKPFVNKGINGQFSGQLLLRFKHDVLDLKPDAVIIKLCEMNFSNDIPMQVTKDNLMMMAALAKSQGIKPFLASVIPVTMKFDQKYGKNINSQIIAFNDWLYNYAQQHEFQYLDYHTNMSDGNGNLRAELTEDGVHPSAAGYKVMAGVIKKMLHISKG